MFRDSARVELELMSICLQIIDLAAALPTMLMRWAEVPESDFQALAKYIPAHVSESGSVGARRASDTAGLVCIFSAQMEAVKH